MGKFSDRTRAPKFVDKNAEKKRNYTEKNSLTRLAELKLIAVFLSFKSFELKVTTEKY